MSNYVVEEELNKLSVPDKQQESNSIDILNNKGLKFLIIGLILLVGIITIFIVSNFNSDSYSSFEKKMVNLAMEYVNNHNIDKSRETYIEVSKLNIKIPNNCSLLSGVFYNGNDYTPYLRCSDYESKILHNSNEIKLKGNEVTFLLQGMKYYELGYYGNNDIIISNKNIEGVGVYNVYYISKNNKDVAIRKVIVLDNPSLANYFPTIIISHDNPVILEIGNKYSESVTAIDRVDGDLTNDIIKVSDVNELVKGEYKSIYSVSNSLGYTTTIMKKVLVVDNNETSEVNILSTLSDENMTNESINVHVKVVGSNYSYMLLPDGSETKEMEFDYLIDENGEYDFTAVLKDNSQVVKSLNITNIDKTIPTGTCSATLYNNKTTIIVNITSFNYIVGYNYYINGNNTGYLTSNFYSSNVKGSNEIFVYAKDYIGNEGKIICSIEDKKSSLYPNGIQNVTYPTGKPRLHIPIGDALAKKGYTINDLNSCIYTKVQEEGPYTRYGVVAAAYGLIDCTYKMTGYVLPYNHSGGKVVEENALGGGKTNYCGTKGINYDICGKLGVNHNWGKSGGACNSSQCWYGLNCATFVRWAMCNGGMNLCSKGSAAAHAMASVDYFPEADGVYIQNDKVTYYSGYNLTSYSSNDLLHMLKPGDVIASTEGGGHVFVVVGLDNEGIYTAEDGYFMRYLKYQNMVKNGIRYRLLFLDKYYENIANRNNLYD